VVTLAFECLNASSALRCVHVADRFCQPRVLRFSERNPNVNTLSALSRLIKRYPSLLAFTIAELDYRDAARAQTLLDVTEHLVHVQREFSGKTESVRLRQWAKSVGPEEWKAQRIRGFGLSGFQYLRMLLGVQTTKPDIHIRRYVSGVIGRAVTDVNALALLEQAAERLKLPLRSLDYAIWSESARKKKRKRQHNR
jgi:hypothetical protein